MKFKRVVAYGCSFTAAEETGDAEYFGVDEEDLDRIKLEDQRRSENKGYVELIRKKGYYYKSEQDSFGHRYSWSSFFAQDYNIACVNRAECGSALKHAVFKIYEDIHKNKIEENDLVVVGLTTTSRIFKIIPQFVPTEGYSKFSRVMSTASFDKWPMNDKQFFTQKDWDDCSKWITHFDMNEYNMNLEYINSVLNLVYLSNTFLKNRLIIIPVLSPFSFKHSPLHRRDMWGFEESDDDMFSMNTSKEYYDNLFKNKDKKNLNKWDIAYLQNDINFDRYIRGLMPSPNEYFIPHLRGKVSNDYLDLLEKMILTHTDNCILKAQSLADFAVFLSSNHFKGKVKHGWGHPTREVHKLYYEKVLKRPLQEMLECLQK